MKTGIIITLYNQESQINKAVLSEFLENQKNIHLCFVNNGSTDNTLSVLDEISQQYPDHTSIVNIKKEKGLEAALKLGFRFLSNLKSFNQLCFIPKINFNELSKITSINKAYQ